MNRSIEVLDRIYQVFDTRMAAFSPACGPGCADCCTCNVTATSLEVAYLVARLDPDEIRAVRDRLTGQAGSDRRYRSRLTTNGFAAACLSGADLPEEENDPAWGQCPLLADGLCTIYTARPLGCRSMMSQVPCTGSARMPPLALTVNTIFLQYIEHLDAGGFSGNFLDILSVYLDGDTDGAFLLENLEYSDKTELFIRNREIPALMIPPEHRRDAAPLVSSLGDIVRNGILEK